MMDTAQNKIAVKENIAEHISDVRAIVDDGGKFFLKVTGNSMLPFLKNGIDIAILSAPNSVKKYETVLYVRASGGVVLHRIVAIHSDCFDMCGDHQVDVERGIPKENIVAVMREYRRNSKDYSCESAFYKIKSVLWVKTRTFRKFYRDLKIKVKRLVKR